MRRLVRPLLVLGAVAILLIAGIRRAWPQERRTAFLPWIASRPEGVIRGLVAGQSEAGPNPIAGATVRIQGGAEAWNTDDSGWFAIPGLASGVKVPVSAWAPGYYIGGGIELLPDSAPVTLTLAPLPAEDDAGYQWLSVEGDGGCQACHSSDAGSPPLPVDLWRQDAHGSSTDNLRFLTMYLGTDVDGNQSPPTEKVCTPDYGCFPLPPDPNLPYYGPGYRLDFPQANGNCASCHAPAEAINDPYGVDPSQVSGVGAEGIGCDFCHKVFGVALEGATGLPADNMPGVLSFSFRRPAPGHQFFAGPFDDVAPGDDTYLPIYQESAYCAPCHRARFWDTVVYNSFGEWLASPYSDPETGQSCQDCHMPAPGGATFARSDQGGRQRDPAALHSHDMPGAGDAALLRQAVSLQSDVTRLGQQLVITATVTNDGTGHHVPSGSPMRHLILLVDVVGADGRSWPLQSGSTVPDWADALEDGQPASGPMPNYGGRPGRVFARVLQEKWTQLAPSAAYWNPTRVVADNRLPAYGSDASVYVFEAGAGPAKISIRLLYRRAFNTLALQKGWTVQDIVMQADVYEIQ